MNSGPSDKERHQTKEVTNSAACPASAFAQTLRILPQRSGSKSQGALRSSPDGELQSPPDCQPVWSNAIRVVTCPDRERSCVWLSRELIFQSEGTKGPSLIRGTGGACRSRHVRAKTWPSETGDELSENMPPSGMKEINICSGAVGGDYAGADWPIREADCEGGDHRDSP